MERLELEIEPGLIPVFRLLSAFELVLLTVVFRLQAQAVADSPGLTMAWVRALLMVPAALMLVYLSWPWLRNKLKKHYLPLALVISSIGPIITQVVLLNSKIPSPYLNDISTSAWQSVLILLVPLVITAWQYPYRTVLLYCFLTSFASLFLVGFSPSVQGNGLLAFLSVLGIRTLVLALMGYMITRLMISQRLQREQLRAANAQMVHYSAALEELTISRERNRMARELHDTLAHTLSGQAVQLEAVKALWKQNPDHAYELLDQAVQSARKGLDETRRAIRSLRAAPLEDLGLVLSLRDLVEKAAVRGNLKIDLDLPDTDPSLSPDVEQCIYRVAQEAMENVLRHAGASRVTLKFSATPRVELLVADDGEGFLKDKVDPQSHFGVAGMQEWAESVGGKCVLTSQPGQGTRVLLTIGGVL